jgi:hypothetical protein
MSFLKNLAGIAAPIAGAALGGPVGGAIGAAIGGLVAGGGSQGERASRRATKQQLAAIQDAQNRVDLGAQASQDFLTPFAEVGQQGLDLAGFLGDPNAQAQFAQNNPLFQLGLDNLNTQTNKSAAARGRLTAGDTLMQLQNNATLAAQPLIDRQRQDILNLLNIGQNTAGQQVGVEQTASQQISDLITGGGSTQAAGTIAGENAASARRGNIFDIGSKLAGNQDVQDYVTNLFGTNNTTPPDTSNLGFNMAGGSV